METLVKDLETLGTITYEKFMDLVKNDEINTLVLAFCDMQGRLMGKRVTGDFCLDNDISEGTFFCTYLLGTDFEMNVPEGFELMNWDTGYGDWLAKPDLNTLKVVPWLDKTALVFCDVYNKDDSEVIPVAPRNILKHQLDRINDMGFQPYMASELEFYLFQDTFEQVHNKGYTNIDAAGHYNEDYNLLQSTRNEPLYQKIREYMRKMGLSVESSKGEAHIGQHEINLKYTDALKAADEHLMFKHGMKEICIQNDHSITFMAKPHHEWTGSSGHIHLSMTDIKSGKNVFFDKESETSNMSPLMQNFLAGVIKHTNDFALFYAPFISSYKRYAPDSWAPTSVAWSTDNRSSGYRVVGNKNSMRFEARIPGSDMNPYLAYAALIGAGIYGVDNKLELPKELEGSAYQNPDVARIPSSLHEAIKYWEESPVVKEVLGETVWRHYLHAAKVEQQTFDSVVTEWEIKRYFEQC